ncbi:MAG: DMT family transporter [Promethearchaeota archaeon]
MALSIISIAAILTLVSGILSGIGHSIQRYGLDTLPELTPRAFYHRHLYLIFAIFTTPIWLLGAILAVSGALMRWQAFSLGDVSFLKPLTNINILIVIVVGVLFLGEVIRRFEWVGLFALLLGVFTLSLFAQERIINTYNVFWYTLSTIVCVILVVLFVLIGSHETRTPREKELFFALGSGILYGMATIYLKAMTIEVIQVLGYFSVLDILSLFILVSRPAFWLYLISSIVAYFLLQCAYSKRRVSVAFPVNNSLSTIVPIIIASLVFGDSLFILINGMIHFPLSYLPVLGILAVLTGLLLLRRFQGSSSSTSLEKIPVDGSRLGETIKGLSSRAQYLLGFPTSHNG